MFFTNESHIQNEMTLPVACVFEQLSTIIINFKNIPQDK